MACDAASRPLPDNYASCKLQKGLGKGEFSRSLFFPHAFFTSGLKIDECCHGLIYMEQKRHA